MPNINIQRALLKKIRPDPDGALKIFKSAEEVELSSAKNYFAKGSFRMAFMEAYNTMARITSALLVNKGFVDYQSENFYIRGREENFGFMIEYLQLLYTKNDELFRILENLEIYWHRYMQMMRDFSHPEKEEAERAVKLAQYYAELAKKILANPQK